MNKEEEYGLKELYPWDRKYNHVHLEGIVYKIMKDNRGKNGKERLIGYFYNVIDVYPKYKYSAILIMADDPDIIKKIEEVVKKDNFDTLVIEGQFEEDIDNRDENGYAPAFVKVTNIVGWMRNYFMRHEDPYEMFKDDEIQEEIKKDLSNGMPEWFNRM